MTGATRRQVLRVGAGVVLGSTAVAAAVSRLGRDDTPTGSPSPTAAHDAEEDVPSLPSQPDLVVLLTDQERHVQHWPEGLIDTLMPSWSRLARHGMRFDRAYCSASECSPSRACLVTGEYPAVNGVPALPPDGMPTLASLPNVASVLGAAGYDVYWKGKWHLSFPEGFDGGPPTDEVWTVADIAGLDDKYGMRGWDPPDAGNMAGAYTAMEASDADARARALATAGGGTAQNDARIVDGASADPAATDGVGESTVDLLDRLGSVPRSERRPFALFVSLVNPHDITFFPNGWQDLDYDPEELEDLAVALPPNAVDALTTKPSIQTAYRDALDGATPLDDGTNSPDNYVRFYAQLHRTVEPHVTRVLDALDANGLTDDTIIVRTADHGELGLSHGLREKGYTAYEEMIRVPLVVSNPTLFPEPEHTDALYSHVDLLPTLAAFAGATPVGVGASMVPVLLGSERSVQDEVLFTFDDSFLLEDLEGSHICALRDQRWTYAIYYKPGTSAVEYELYDNNVDPGQLDNLLYAPTTEIGETWRDLHERLLAKLAATGSTPEGVDLTLTVAPEQR